MKALWEHGKESERAFIPLCQKGTDIRAGLSLYPSSLSNPVQEKLRLAQLMTLMKRLAGRNWNSQGQMGIG
jgi:hypothetical protein